MRRRYTKTGPATRYGANPVRRRCRPGSNQEVFVSRLCLGWTEHRRQRPWEEGLASQQQSFLVGGRVVCNQRIALAMHEDLESELSFSQSGAGFAHIIRH